jgi:hypothetical protein
MKLVFVESYMVVESYMYHLSPLPPWYCDLSLLIYKSGEVPPGVVEVHKDFAMWVLANRPGFPFLGNNFFRETGDGK